MTGVRPSPHIAHRWAVVVCPNGHVVSLAEDSTRIEDGESVACRRCIVCKELVGEWVQAAINDRSMTSDQARDREPDSHWASVAVDPESMEPRECTEAELKSLEESGVGIGLERMWIQPGTPPKEET